MRRFITTAVILMAVLFGSGCDATLEIRSKNVITVHDENNGVSYRCSIEKAEDGKEIQCGFLIQKGPAVYRCSVSFKKTINFILENDCEVVITVEE